MADAHAQTTDQRSLVALLSRQIEAELEIVEHRGRDCYVRVGGLLTQLRPLLGARWKSYIRERFNFSEVHARRYMKFYTDVKIHQKPHTRLSDVDPPRPDHQPKGFSAWRASQDQQTRPRTRFDTEQAKSDRPRERELGLELIEAGFKLLSKKYHSDTGGATADERSFRCLVEVRARLRRCLLG